MKRILIVDSSPEVQGKIQETLGSQFTLISALSCAEARGHLGQQLFDLILLEANLADGDGLDLCIQLKNKEMTSDIPVVFLSERSTIQDIVKAFEAGAEDFISKPFEPLELSARIVARLRKSRTQDQETQVQKGDLVLSIPYQKAVLKEVGVEKDLRLTPTEFRLLYFFIKNEGEILSRTQLLSTIWSEDVHVLARTIDKHISTLKKKLAGKANYIQSIHSRGYRFSVSKAASREVSGSVMGLPADL